MKHSQGGDKLSHAALTAATATFTAPSQQKKKKKNNNKKKHRRAFYREEPLRALDIDGSSPALLCIINPGQRTYST